MKAEREERIRYNKKTQGIRGGCGVIAPGRGEIIGIENSGKRIYLLSKTPLLSFSPGEQNSSSKHFKNTQMLYLYGCNKRV